MNYFISLILPPLAVFLSGARLQVIVNVLIFAAAVASLTAANQGAFVGGFAAGPVLYVVSVIHAFVFSHRFYQRESGQRHPHSHQ